MIHLKRAYEPASRTDGSQLLEEHLWPRGVKRNPSKLLATIGEARKVVAFPDKRTVFTQGDASDSVFYILSGKVKFTVLSKSGKEATLAILNRGDFFGEYSLTGQRVRMGSATAMRDCELIRIDKKAMMVALHGDQAFSDMFVAYLLKRKIRYQESLVDQLFNSSEKRLARTLLLLAPFGKEDAKETVIPKISQETLAEMIGTTRSRVSFFMTRFRKLGFVDYGKGELYIHSSLLRVLLHDKRRADSVLRKVKRTGLGRLLAELQRGG